MAGIRIDALNSTVLPSPEHEFPAMKDGMSVKLTIGQIVHVAVQMGLVSEDDLGDSASLDVGTTTGTVAAGDDSRLSDAREWTAAVVSQVEAEAGTATTARKWTAERVRQAALAAAPPSPVGLYTGTNADEANFPIGHIVAAGGAGGDRNQSYTVRTETANSGSYRINGTGGIVLAGTWRARGATTRHHDEGAGSPLMQRTA